MELERGSYFGGHCFSDDSDGNRVGSFGAFAQMILRLACCYPSISVNGQRDTAGEAFLFVKNRKMV